MIATLLGAAVLVGMPIASYASSTAGAKPTATKPTTTKGSTKSSTTSSSKRTSGAKGATGSKGSGASEAAFTNCLKSHGVTIPTSRPGGATGSRGPGFRGTSGAKGATGRFPRPSGATGARGFGAFSSPTLQKALAACAKYRPAGNGGFGFGFPGGSGGGGFRSPALQTYLNCLKLHGVTVPSGASGARGRPSGATGPSYFNPTNPKVKTAMADCKALLPKPSGATGSRA